MLKLTELTPESADFDDAVTLPFDARQKCRLLSRTDKGREVGIFLPRGQAIKHGFVLNGNDNYRVRIKAAAEDLSVVKTNDPLLFARACYHLGNRHIPLQIQAGELRYLADHVLDGMLEGFGLTVNHQSLPFEPEPGAYHQHGH
jgi:urease accessory protein